MKFTNIIFFAVLFLIMSYASAAQITLTSYSENDRKHISAMGLVLDDITKAALSNAKVVLTNRSTEQHHCSYIAKTRQSNDEHHTPEEQ